MSIYAFEIEAAIAKLEEAGVNVIKDDYVIYAGKSAEFDADLFPLPIIVVEDSWMPDTVAYIAKRDQRLDLQTHPPVTKELEG